MIPLNLPIDPKASLLKPLMPQGESIPVQLNEFYHVAAAIAESKQGMRQSILTKIGANQNTESIEELAHVARSGIQIDSVLHR